MEEATHYKQGAYLLHTLYITVQVKEARPAKNQSVVLLGMYVENNSAITLTPQGSSRLGVLAYNGGSAQSFTFPTPVAAEGVTWLAKDLEILVTHAPDGTAAAVPLSWLWNVQALGANPLSGSCTVELLPLDLATTPSIYTTNYYSLGDTMLLSADPCQRSFTHDLSYDILGHTGEIARGVSGRLEWTIPEELLTALTSRHYTSVNLVCTTYNNEVCLGTKSRSFYLKPGAVGNMQGQEGWCRLVPESDNETVDAWGVCLEGTSRVRVEIDYDKVLPAAGATLSKTQVYMDGRLYGGLTSPILRQGHTFRVVLTDSRGYILSHTEKITPYPYSPPALSGVSCFRSDLEGVAEDAGAYLFVDYTPVYSPVGGHNTATTELKLYTPAGVLLSAQILNGSGVYGGNLSAQNSYRAELVITDALGNTNSMTFTIPSQTVVFQLREGGDGAAFGGLSTERDCLDILWNRLRVGGQEVADFPVEQGTVGCWTYQKWKSGLAQCWGCLSGEITANTPMGSLYTGTISGEPLPFPFAEVPLVLAIPSVSGSNPWWVGAPSMEGSATQTPAFSLVSPQSTTISYRLGLLCTGRWKE